MEIIGRAKHGVPLLVVGQHTKRPQLTSHRALLHRSLTITVVEGEENVKGADSDGLMVSSQI